MGLQRGWGALCRCPYLNRKQGPTPGRPTGPQPGKLCEAVGVRGRVFSRGIETVIPMMVICWVNLIRLQFLLTSVDLLHEKLGPCPQHLPCSVFLSHFWAIRTENSRLGPHRQRQCFGPARTSSWSSKVASCSAPWEVIWPARL